MSAYAKYAMSVWLFIKDGKLLEAYNKIHYQTFVWSC